MKREIKIDKNQMLNKYKTIFNQMTYYLLDEKLFQSFGLELSALSINFETNESFALLNKTFAYFNPIDNTIHVNIEDPFFMVSYTSNNEAEIRAKLLFILFHEVYHKVLKHDSRKGSREHTLFNIASDFEVHNMLYLYKECCLANKNNSDTMISNISSFINDFELINLILTKSDKKDFEPDREKGEVSLMFSKDFLNNIAEEIYAKLLDSKKVSQKSYKIDLNKMMSDSNNQSDNNQDNNSDSEQAGNKNQKSKSNQNNNSNQTGDKSSEQNGNKSKQNSSQNKNSDGTDTDDDTEQVEGKNSSQSNSGQTNGSNPSVTVTETTYTLPNGKTITDVSIQWPDMSELPDKYKKSKEEMQNDAENAELRRQIMEQTVKSECERNKGNMSASCNEFMKKLFKVKIDWEKILKTSLQTVLTKSDYFSWARPRRTTMTLDLPYLPDIIDDNGSYGKLFICVDQSGSMSDKEFQKIGNIILDAKEHYKKIIVIQHDTEINNVFEFDEINDDTLKHVFTRTSCGGTSHLDVYKYIANDFAKTRYDEENKISAVIVCSDCCSDIQMAQKKLAAEIPMIYLVPTGAMEYTKDIRGKIIPIE